MRKKKGYLIFGLIFSILLLLFYAPSSEFSGLFSRIITQNKNDNVDNKYPNENTSQISTMAEIDSGKQQVVLIVEAIEDYFDKNEEYPKTLNELVPDYLDEIPKTITNQDFQYWLSEVDNFIVAYPLKTKNNHYMCGYIKKMEEWECSGTGE